jgi:hypothetical protein
MIVAGRDVEIGQYRAVSAVAVAGLIMAVVSLVAFAHPVFWPLPVAAAAVNVAALRRIADHASALLGRPLAFAGLAIALAIGAAAPTQYFVSIERSQLEARQFVRLWFDAVKTGRVDLAAALLLSPTARHEHLADSAELEGDGPLNRKSLESFSDNPVVRALLVLGESAHIHFLETQMHQTTLFSERMRSLWAVTYEKDGKRQSFLVRVILERNARHARRVHEWEFGRMPDLVTTPPQGWRQASSGR